MTSHFHSTWTETFSIHCQEGTNLSKGCLSHQTMNNASEKNNNNNKKKVEGEEGEKGEVGGKENILRKILILWNLFFSSFKLSPLS